MLDMIGGKYASREPSRLGMRRSSVDELRRSLFPCSPRSTIAPLRVMWSAFENEFGTISGAQPSLTVASVVYDTYKLVRTVHGPISLSMHNERSGSSVAVVIHAYRKNRHKVAMKVAHLGLDPVRHRLSSLARFDPSACCC